MHPWADVVLPEPEHHAGVMAAAGQLWAPLSDLGRFAAFLLGDTADVLAPATLEEMTVPAGVDSSAPGWSAYGLGVQVLRIDGRTLVGHGGSMPGFLAGVFVDREEKTGAVSLANTTSGLDTVVFGLLEDLRTAEPRIVEPGRRRRRRCRWTSSASGSGARRPYVLRSVGGGLLHLGPLPGRSGRASRFCAAGRRHVGRPGRLLRRGDAADRRGPPRPRHVHLHPRPLRPRRPGAGRRRRARLAVTIGR